MVRAAGLVRIFLLLAQHGEEAVEGLVGHIGVQVKGCPARQGRQGKGLVLADHLLVRPGGSHLGHALGYDRLELFEQLGTGLPFQERGGCPVSAVEDLLGIVKGHLPNRIAEEPCGLWRCLLGRPVHAQDEFVHLLAVPEGAEDVGCRADLFRQEDLDQLVAEIAVGLCHGVHCPFRARGQCLLQALDHRGVVEG